MVTSRWPRKRPPPKRTPPPKSHPKTPALRCQATLFVVPVKVYAGDDKSGNALMLVGPRVRLEKLWTIRAPTWTRPKTSSCVVESAPRGSFTLEWGSLWCSSS